MKYRASLSVSVKDDALLKLYLHSKFFKPISQKKNCKESFQHWIISYFLEKKTLTIISITIAGFLMDEFGGDIFKNYATENSLSVINAYCTRSSQFSDMKYKPQTSPV